MSDSSMTEMPDDESATIPTGPGADENLPPVEPPSAGFIVQLFFVPALIVAAVVAVWALFGQMAADDQDWQSLLVELSNENPHRRWRGAHGLAQMLQVDQTRTEGDGELAHNAQVATQLTDMLREQIANDTGREDDLNHQVFLTRTLGLMDVPGTVIPVLQLAMKPDRDREVRKHAIAAIAIIADRAAQRGQPLDSDGLLDDLIEFSYDPDPLARQLSAFALGLIPDERSKQQLVTLLGNADESTRLNAAIGLARQHSPAGLEVLKAVLTEALQPTAAKTEDDPGVDQQQKLKAAEKIFEKHISLKNTLKAITDLAADLTPEQKAELRALIEPIAESHQEHRIRLDAGTAQRELE